MRLVPHPICGSLTAQIKKPDRLLPPAGVFSAGLQDRPQVRIAGRITRVRAYAGIAFSTGLK